MKHTGKFSVALIAALVVASSPLPVAAMEADTLAERLAEEVFDQPQNTTTLVVVGERDGRPTITTVKGIDNEAEAATAIENVDRSTTVTDAAWEQTVTLSAVDHTSQQWGLPAIGVSNAWTKSTGSGVIVAVVDSGVAAHPDLNVLPGFTTVGGTVTSGGQNDTVGHGTHVAGIIAAKNDGSGTTGVAPAATILPIKAFSGTTATVADVARGIIKAVDEGAKVINMSFGYNTLDPAMDSALGYAFDRGVILVAASGNGASRDDNDPSNDLSIDWPAKDSRVIGVGSVKNASPTPVISWFSDGGDTLDVVAPGSNVISTSKTLSYEYQSGTSMASPHVAGVSALLIARHPTVTPTAVRELLVTTSTDLGDPGFDTAYGHGLVNATAALNAADTRYGAPTNAAPAQTPVITGLGDVTKTYGDNTFTLTPTAAVNGSNVNGNWAYTSSDVNVASIGANGTVTLNGAGSSTLTATLTPADLTLYNQVSGTLTLTVNKNAQTITFPAVTDKEHPTSFTVNPTASSELAVTLTSGTPSICTVDGLTVTTVKAGTCTLNASQNGNSNYQAAAVLTRGVIITEATIRPIAETPTVTGFGDLTKTYGDSAFTLTPVAKVNGATVGGTWTYTSSNEQVATVRRWNGAEITVIGAGSSTLTARFTPNDLGAYNQVNAELTLTVEKKNQLLVFGAITDKQHPISFSVNPIAASGERVEVTSTTPSICAVDGLTVTTVKAGTCTLTADQDGNNNYSAAQSVVQSFTVTEVPSPSTGGGSASGDPTGGGNAPADSGDDAPSTGGGSTGGDSTGGGNAPADSGDDAPSTGGDSTGGGNTPRPVTPQPRATINGELLLSIQGTDIVASVAAGAATQRLVLRVGSRELATTNGATLSFTHSGAATITGPYQYQVSAYNAAGELGDSVTKTITVYAPGVAKIVGAFKTRTTLRVTAKVPAGRNTLVVYRDGSVVGRFSVDGGKSGRSVRVSLPYKRGGYQLRMIGQYGASPVSLKKVL